MATFLPSWRDCRRATGPGTNQLRLAIGLPFRHQEDLTNLLQRLYNPASADNHRFPATEEFIRQFGPLEQDYQAVIDFARGNGLEVVGTYPNRMLVDVRATVADVGGCSGIGMGTGGRTQPCTWPGVTSGSG